MPEAFEAVILLRRVTQKFRLTRLCYPTTWRIWKFGVNLISSRKGSETLLGFYGPISLLILVGAVGLVLSFGAYATRCRLHGECHWDAAELRDRRPLRQSLLSILETQRLYHRLSVRL